MTMKHTQFDALRHKGALFDLGLIEWKFWQLSWPTAMFWRTCRIRSD